MDLIMKYQLWRKGRLHIETPPRVLEFFKTNPTEDQVYYIYRYIQYLKSMTISLCLLTLAFGIGMGYIIATQ